jgi:pimeloyl-ACP methyl ester carboxylesterase
MLVVVLLGLFVIGRIGMSSHESRDRAMAPIGPDAAFIETRSGRVHYLDRGEGPVIMLFHGTGRSIADWQEGLAESLSKSHRVIAFDYYGLGLSDRNHDWRYGLVLWSEQAIDLMDALEVEHATLVGHSAGGAVVSLVAARNPKRVDNVVTLGTGIALDPMQALPLIPGVGEIVMGRSEMFTNTFSPKHREALKAAYEIKGTRRALLTFIRRQYTIDGVALMWGGFDSIKAPVLHLHGEFDASIPVEAGRRLSERSGGKFVEVPGASHDVHVDATEFVAQHVLDFVS